MQTIPSITISSAVDYSIPSSLNLSNSDQNSPPDVPFVANCSSVNTDSSYDKGEPGNLTKAMIFDPGSVDPQFSSPLFITIPPEIRALILEYALRDYEDKSNSYRDKQPYYLTPRKTDKNLLRTCKRIYLEGWWLPLTNAEYAIYLTSPSWSAPGGTTKEQMKKILCKLHKAGIVQPKIEHVRVFAQLRKLELQSGLKLRRVLNMKHFHPRVITLTIRHTDWRDWRHDGALTMDGQWVGTCRFPDSLMEFKIAFESLERKKEQIDEVTQQAIESWRFLRKGGVVLSAEGSVPAIVRWSGASTWGKERWLRDETRPGQLDYYVSTVTWKPKKSVTTVDPETVERGESKSLIASTTKHLRTDMDSITVSMMRRAGIRANTPADEVFVKWRQYNSLGAARGLRRNALSYTRSQVPLPEVGESSYTRWQVDRPVPESRRSPRFYGIDSLGFNYSGVNNDANLDDIDEIGNLFSPIPSWDQYLEAFQSNLGIDDGNNSNNTIGVEEVMMNWVN